MKSINATEETRYFCPATVLVMASPLSIFDLVVLLSSLIAFQAVRDYRRRGGVPYPPGPRPLPVLGNLLHIPKEHSWLTYTQYSKKYGDVISFRVFGQVIVVLNTIKAAKDLLERRGEIYSDRPETPIYDMMEWQWILPAARYGDTWRSARRLLDRGLRPGAAASYRPMQQARARVLMTRLLASPDKWEDHIELLQGELLLDMTYGYQVLDRQDRKFDMAKRLTEFGTTLVLPGALLVNNFSFLRHIPEWLPRFSYKPLARYGHAMGVEVVNEPIHFVKESILRGTARPSLALQNLQEIEKLSGSDRDKAEKMVSGALASLYSAGSDTTVSATLTFFLVCLLHPEIQKKAQEEIDAVTGRERFPSFEDRPRLPFVDAICKEVLRWMPVTPLVPHAVTQDDVYEGLFIPKGAIVFGNTWAILHDPDEYEDPDAFKPERFLNSNGSLRDDLNLTSAFGYGKRICPGRHFVDATLFITVASLLSVFNIKKRKEDEDGAFRYTYTGDSVISHPNRFGCSVVPRDKIAEELINADTLSR
ncbi:cytochrome P450 [Multifurca ochricompacta]|uniref:Cytochrome P450 n=1 Tax=Multifurca ochricompacta TaxID=376703 RepID=A0AAD4M567_9AGAM|nr:cytochrome P450 [Multifurca ochricompacta]